MVVIIITTCKTSHFSKVKIVDACFMLHLVRRKKNLALGLESTTNYFILGLYSQYFAEWATQQLKTTAKKLWQLVYSWGMMRNDSSEKLSKADTEEKSILYESD